MPTKPTHEAIQTHQHFILEKALKTAEDAIDMPGEFVFAFRNAIALNDSGDIDGALDAAQHIQQDLQSLVMALSDVMRRLRGIDEDPITNEGN